jgi:hypothetical protein
MHLLATKHWQNLSLADPKTSRINWTRNVIDGYFFEGGLEKKRRKHSRNQPAERCNQIIKNTTLFYVFSKQTLHIFLMPGVN